MDSVWTLFVSALISSTLLPGGSEALLTYQISQHPSAWPMLVVVATVGNSLGSYITFMMGRLVAYYYPLKALDKPIHKRAKVWLNRWGSWTLLLAWLPLIGDPLCLLAGWLRVNLLLAFVAIALGKLLRFVVVGLVALQIV